jgi:hypothetical protein
MEHEVNWVDFLRVRGVVIYTTDTVFVVSL